MQGAIAKLWKLNDKDIEGIASKLIIFGNACEDADKDEPLSQEDENDAKRQLYDMFLELCAKADGPDSERPMYNAKKDLVRNKVSYLYKKENRDDIEKYRILKNTWILEDLSDGAGVEYTNASSATDELIQRMEIEEGNVVGIDIALLYGDLERLREKKRIISMELCYKLSNNHVRCFMYSSEADDDELMRNWQEVYKSLYQEAGVKIYQRSDFMQKGKVDVIAEIECMFV